MTTDVRTLLHEAADAPERAPDIDGALRSARARRRRSRGLGALAAVVVLALVVGVLVLGSGGGGDGARVAIGPRQSGSQVPDGWHRVDLGAGIGIALPPGWDTYDFGQPVDPAGAATHRLSIGTGPLPGTGTPIACTDGQSADVVLPAGPGSWIAMWEFDGTSSQIALPGGDIMGGFGERPVTFVPFASIGASCDQVGNDPSNGLAGTFTEFAFVDGGRVFGVKAVSAAPAGQTPDLTEAMRVLDTLTVQPSISATTTTEPATTVPAPQPVITQLPATTAAPFVPTTADERAITDLFVAWLRDHPDEETRAIVEDGDALLGVIHQGLAQHSAADLAKYSGTVSAVRMLDTDHAEVEYTLLFDGVPQFGLRTGVAVRIDGRWMVSRATECSLLSLGGLTCPPAS